MLQGLKYLHSNKNLCHRDLKPDNILVDVKEDFGLKILDYGFMCRIQGEDGSGVLTRPCGTQYYMAPQIWDKAYSGTAADLFACGVTLFVMHAGNYPWETAKKDDKIYSLLAQKKYDIFWKVQEKGNPRVNFSEDFKSLVTMMIEESPQDRVCMADIIVHPWL